MVCDTDDADCDGLDYQDIQYHYQDSYDYDMEPEGTFSDLCQYCLGPTISDTLYYMLPLFLASIIFKLIAQSRYMPYNVFHILSIVIGVFVIRNYAPECLCILVVLMGVTYIFLHIPEKYHKGFGVFLPSLVLIVYCEISMEPSSWHKVRSIVMIGAMKGISVAIDNTDSLSLPSFYEYLGYMFGAATCLFGPWISFKNYIDLYQKNYWNIPTISKTIGYFLASLTFLITSNCITQWIFSDNSNKWLLAYRDALSFRTSHYFISYTASTIMLLGGYPMSLVKITKPMEIELPRSLVQVVVSWNNPMHFWLKTYIFRPCRTRLGRFGAVIITYLTSSLLHGLNFQLAAVLLSLGFYTYIEFQLRHTLAYTFNACVAAKSCTDRKCTHDSKIRNSLWVVVTNLSFSALTIFHLSYLGLMFDVSDQQETGYSYSHTMDKWSQLGFASHWVALAMYCAQLLIG
ncbi:protein-serine O-palmitoleoyltransferase porcupine [Orussus abietinus]|uniref:protein-serine O-palmitoleoyltransferase porcupine n=1 Tax=Orussus abietinus TaxID=222816 RepID=UPI000626CFBB|nr:protein-serine O-palmitoleoyltransferase porcupine [Orussus abietinus]